MCALHRSSLVRETCVHYSKSAESVKESLITPLNPDTCTSGLAASEWPAHTYTQAHTQALTHWHAQTHTHTKAGAHTHIQCIAPNTCKEMHTSPDLLTQAHNVAYTKLCSHKVSTSPHTKRKQCTHIHICDLQPTHIHTYTLTQAHKTSTHKRTHTSVMKVLNGLGIEGLLYTHTTEIHLDCGHPQLVWMLYWMCTAVWYLICCLCACIYQNTMLPLSQYSSIKLEGFFSFLNLK
jgi:hypothetical protein